jgi:DNA polymerase-3 subunit alpha
LQRIDLKSTNKKAFESLAKAGAFDCFGGDKLTTRAIMLESVDSSVDKAAKIKKDMETTQGFLFDSSETMSSSSSLQKAKPLTLLEALDFEKEVLGFYLSGHPLADRKKELIAYSNFRLDKLPPPKENASHKNAQLIRVAGMIAFIKKLVAKKDKKPYARFKIEDLHGAVDAVILSKKFEEAQNYLIPNNIVVIKGLLMGTSEQPEIVVNDIMTIEEAKEKFPPNRGETHIKLSTTRYDDDLGKNLKEIFKTYQGKSKVFFDLEDTFHGKFLIETKYFIDYSDKFIGEIENLIGVKDSVELHFQS